MSVIFLVVCSGVSRRLTVTYPVIFDGMLQDMSEILSYMSSGLWSDRRDGLCALQQYIDNQNPMTYVSAVGLRWLFYCQFKFINAYHMVKANQRAS